MDWLYQEDGADRLKHHQWMLTRPSYLAIARVLHRIFAMEGDNVIRSVTANSDFPDGLQRTLALKVFHCLQRPDGAEVTMFLFATACELIGTTPFCAYQEAALKKWTADALAEPFRDYGSVYNLMINIVSQAMLWVLGCFPYAALQRQVMSSSNDLSFGIDADTQRLLLRRYSLSINAEMQRISRHPSVSRTYQESKVH
jgi:hypothetical protein